MKRATYFIIEILFLALVLPLSTQAAQSIGNISKLKGTAQIFREEVPSPITAYVGIPLYLHDRVRTADNSAVRIELLDGSILSMGKKADLHLDDFSFLPKEKKRSAFFRMAVGKLRVFAKKLIGFRERGFKVGTPTAVVGVRGTFFLVWVQSDTITKVACFEDMIEVANALSPEEYIVLTKNLVTDIIGGETPSEPILMTEDQLRELQEELEEVPTAPETTETMQTTGETTTSEATTTTSTTTTTTSTTTTTTTTSTTTTTTTSTMPEATTTTTTTTTLPGPPEPPSG